jgi:hypothetical protein
MRSTHDAPSVQHMEDVAREAVVDSLVRDSGAVRESIEIVRQRRSGDRISALARWNESQTGRVRRGGVDLVKDDDVWRGQGGWSSNADYNADHPVWQAWGGTSHSMSGWTSDPATVKVRLRSPQGSLQEDSIENGVAILIFDTAFDRESLVECLDEGGNILHTAALV